MERSELGETAAGAAATNRAVTCMVSALRIDTSRVPME